MQKDQHNTNDAVMKTVSQKLLYSGTESEITEHAAALIIFEAYRAIQDHGRFSLVLSGGKSPKLLYRQLAQGVAMETLERYAFQIPRNDNAENKDTRAFMPWNKTWLFWGDERSVPVGHPDCNYRLVREELLSQVTISEKHIFRMPAELNDGEVAAKVYEETIRTFFSEDGSLPPKHYPVFDLIILGLGEDGNTASLFADNAFALQKTEKWVIAVNEPLANPPGKRLTLTMPVINHARNVLFFTRDKAKATLAKKIFFEEEQKVPASLVKPVNGKTFWFTVQL